MEALTSQLYSSSLELLMLIIAIAIDIFLAVVVLRSNPKNATNRIFSLLTVFTMLWLTATYALRLHGFFDDSLTMHRLGIFFAAPMSALFFLLAHTFPEEKLQMSRRSFYVVIGLTILMMGLNISPFAFTDIAVRDGLTEPVPGLGLIPFSVLSTLFSILALYWLLKKLLRSDGIVRKQLRLVFIGILLMLGFIIATILVPVIVFGSVAFLGFTPLYALIFLGLTAYAITQYQLFDIKVLLTQALTLVIWLVLFAKIFADESMNAKVIDALVLLFAIISGFFLVRSVRREVEQRQLIEKQEKELERANERLRELDRQKSEFVSIASHQLRSPLTAIKGYASLILEGSYGIIVGELKEAIQRIFDSSNLMALSVEDFLNVSRIEQGRMKYEFAPVELGTFVRAAVEEMEPTAHEHKLALHFKSHGEPFHVSADVGKLKQVLANLIDNALKYTPKGSVTVLVTRADGHVRIEVSDTGVGMSKETIGKLFDKFVRARNANQVNVTGTGLGLYVVREFVKAHQGTVRAESDGEGKGSTFIVELPALKR